MLIQCINGKYCFYLFYFAFKQLFSKYELQVLNVDSFAASDTTLYVKSITTIYTR